MLLNLIYNQTSFIWLLQVMSKQLSDLPNIGPELERLLIKVGINTPERLRKLGAVKACLRLREIGEACHSKLYALEGAIQDVRWHKLHKKERDLLKKQYNEN